MSKVLKRALCSVIAVGTLMATGCEFIEPIVKNTLKNTESNLSGCWVSETDAGTGKVTNKFEFTQQKDSSETFDVVNTVTTPDGNGGTNDAKATKQLKLKDGSQFEFTLTDKNIDGSLTDNSAEGSFDIEGSGDDQMLVLKDGAKKETGRYSRCK